MEIPFNNLTLGEGRNFKTGIMVYVSKDDFCLLVLSFWMPSSQTSSLSVTEQPQESLSLCQDAECTVQYKYTVHFIKVEQPLNENISWDVGI